jgi:hypothetical protein
MSTAATAPKFPTNGYAPIPNSLIENQGLLTRGEFGFALIVIRRGGVGNNVPVSDRNWENWTGLSPRLKEYSIAGLRKKGCLNVTGHGEQAKFSFERREFLDGDEQHSGWDKFVMSAVPAHRPRTEGRRATPVAAKAGAMVHPACRANGCAMLAAEAVQPVAQNPGGLCSKARSVTTGLKTLTVLPATSIAQPVAQMVTDAAEQVWAKTLLSLRCLFPWVGVAFLVRLVVICRAVFHDLQDDELSQAVTVAYDRKRNIQKSEGLFIHTVPEILAAIRKRPKPPEPAPPLDRSGIEALFSRVLMAVRSRGAPFAPLLPALEDLSARVQTDDIFELDRTAERLERQIIAIADGLVLAEPDRAAVARRVQDELARLGSSDGRNMLPVQREELKNRIRGQVLLDQLQIPRLSQLYV